MKLSAIHFHFCQLPPPKFESALCFSFAGQAAVALRKRRPLDSLVTPRWDHRFRMLAIAKRIGVKIETRKLNGAGWKITKVK